MSQSEHFLTALGAEPSRLLTELLSTFPHDRVVAWLVGGAVRDLLHAETPDDFDIAFTEDLTPLVKSWARRNSGHWFWLDKKRKQSRVVFVAAGLQFDFSALRAADIRSDLELRDFTLNAMALPLSVDTLITGVIDPLGGQKALNDGILKGCSPGVFLDDPLRVLKGVRHVAERGWQVDPQTARLFVAAAPGLMSVAGERIKSELGKILGSDRVSESLALLCDFGVLDLLFPQIDKLGLFGQLETMTERVSRLKSEPCIHDCLEQTLEEDVTLSALLCFALLWLRIPSCANPAAVLARLHFSKRGQATLKALQEAPTVPEKILNAVIPRILALQLEACGPHCVERLIFTLLMKKTADVDAQAGVCLAAYMKYAQDGRIRHLLDGKRLLTLTDLKPGPQIGYWQQRIKDAEIAGEIWDEPSAVSWLKEQFSD